MIYGLLLVFFRPHTLQTHYNKAIVKAKLTIKLLLWISALVFFRAKMTLFNGIREKCWTKGVGKVRGRIWIYGKFMFPSDFPLLFTILSGTQIPLQRPKINFSITGWFYADSKASKCDFSDTVNCDAKDKKESRLFCSHLLLSLYIWFPGSASAFKRKSFSTFLKDNLTICRHFVNIKAYALCHPADTIFPERKPFFA